MDHHQREEKPASSAQAEDGYEKRLQDLTAKLKKAEQELGAEIDRRKRMEQQLHLQTSALEAAANGIIITGKDGDILWVNPAITHMTGYPLNEILGKNPRIFKSGLQDPRFYQELWETILSGNVWRGELINRRKDGGTYDEELTITPILNENGELENFIAIKRDISEHKREERELQRASELLERMFFSIDILIAYMDRDFNFLRVNRAYAESDGREPEFFPGKNHFDLYPNEENKAIFTRVVETGEPYIVYEKPFVYADHPERGVTYWDWILQPVKDASGKVDSVLLSLENVTERIRTELDLRKNEELLRRVLETMPVGIWIMDAQGSITHGNPASQQIWGGAQYVGIDQYKVYKGWWVDSGKEISSHEWAAARAIEKGETCLDEEIEIECFDGSHKIILNSAIPLRDEEQHIIGGIIINQDITERKRTSAQLEKTNRELLAVTQSERNLRKLAEGLAQASIALNASLELDVVFDLIFEQVGQIIPITSAYIALVEGDTFSIAQHWGFENLPAAQEAFQQPFLLADFPIKQAVCRAQKPVLVNDTSGEQDWRPIAGLEGIRCSMVAPLLFKGQVVGLINVFNDQPNCFSQEMMARLVAFAAPAAVAVQNARLYAAEQRTRQVAETLSAASLALIQSLDIDTVLDKILEYIQILVPYDRASLSLVGEVFNLTVRAVRGSQSIPPPKELLNRTLSAEEWPHIQAVLETQDVLLIPDTQMYPGWKPFLGLPRVRNWLGIPLVSGEKTLGILIMAKIQPNFFTQEHIDLAKALVVQAIIALQNAWLFEQVRLGRERLQSLARRLVEVQENERRYIARELHDEAGQTLTSLLINMRLLEQEAEDPAQVLIHTTELKKTAAGILENLHRLAMDLRPASLDHLGLEAALQQLVNLIGEQTRIVARFRKLGFMGSERLDEVTQTALYRIVQEALTNVVRHADATYVDVIMELRRGMIAIIVEDDGVGFNAGIVKSHNHLGMVGMQERAEMLGGSLVVESTPGSGTTLVVQIPFTS